MFTRLAAQGVTDAWATVAVGAYVAAVLRRRPKSPLDVRLAFAFGTTGLFYLFRTAAELTGARGFEVGSLLLASLLPLAALLLAEGLLRRHAPRLLKAAIVLVTVVLALGLCLSAGAPPFSTLGLGGFVVLSLLAVSVLVLARDRGSLSGQENAGLDALMLAGASLALISLTDFLPAAPLGMSGAGVAVLSLLALSDLPSLRAMRAALAELLILAAGAAGFAAMTASVLPVRDPAEAFRFGVALFTLVTAATCVLRARRQRVGDEARALRQALAEADLSGLSAFLESLGGQPLLEGLRISEGPALADYDAGVLADALATAPIRTAAGLEQTTLPPLAREELADLFARTETTHAALISRVPLRIALFVVSGVGASEAAATDLCLFSKLAAVAAERHA